MIPSIHVLSNPIGTLAKLLYTHSTIIDPSQLRPHGVNKADLEFLITQALARQSDSRFTGNLERYKFYMEGKVDKKNERIFGGFLDNLHLIQGRQTIFLGFENLCLEDPQGKFKRECIDDFSTKSNIAEYIMKVYALMPDSVKERMRELVFYRLSVYDFPFMIGEEEAIKIYNPFSDVIRNVNWDLLNRKKPKSPLGDYERFLNDKSREGNYRFSRTIFSIKDFRRQYKKPGFLDSLLEAYNKVHDSVTVDELKRLSEAAIRLNRELIKIKYSELIRRLNLENITAYVLQGDLSKKILEKIDKDTRVPGKKLLHDTKNLPTRGILEPQALNKLSGWLTAKFRDPDEPIEPVIIEKGNYRDALDFSSSRKNPFIKTIGNPKDIDEGIKSIDDYSLGLLKGDVRNYGFNVSSIEVILVRLNYENFMVETDETDTQWQDILDGSRVHPFKISDIEESAKFVKRFVRPSNCGAGCEFHKFINLFPEDHWEGMGSSEAAISGKILHHISNELQTKQHKFLADYGIIPLPRKDYCEVQIAHEFTPSELDWLNAESAVKGRIDKTESPFFIKMLDGLMSARDSGAAILYYGKSDGVAFVGSTNEPVIIDLKRRMKGYYPVRHFFEQASRYALAVIQSKALEPENFYTVIVQTPPGHNRGLREEVYYEQSLRDQVFTIRKVRTAHDFLAKVKCDIILEFLGNQLFDRDPEKGFLIRELYKDKRKDQKPSCNNCFANSQKFGSYQCNFLLTGRKELWE